MQPALMNSRPIFAGRGSWPWVAGVANHKIPERVSSARIKKIKEIPNGEKNVVFTCGLRGRWFPIGAMRETAQVHTEVRQTLQDRHFLC